MRRLLPFILASLLAAPALSDVSPTNVRGLAGGQGQTGTICSAETTTGDCASTDEIVLDGRGWAEVTFFGLQSTASAYTCDVIMSDQGHDDGSGEGQDISATQMTETNQIVSYEIPLGFLWINCSTITGGNVTVTYILTR